MLETPYEKLVRSNSEFCEENLREYIVEKFSLKEAFEFNNEFNNKFKEEAFRTKYYQNLIEREFKNIEHAVINEFAKEHDVSYELAKWYLEKYMKLTIRVDYDNYKLEVKTEFKSIEDILHDIHVDTEYDKKMEKELIESTLGKVKKGD